MTDLYKLFDDQPRLERYKDIYEELKAVSNGSKSMSVVSCPLSEIHSSENRRIVNKALKLGLLVIYHGEAIDRGSLKPYQNSYIFFLLSGQEWRIPAYIATRRALRNYPWSDAAEFLESHLLGYESADIVSWIKKHHQRRVGWIGYTVYLLTPIIYMNRLKELGMRSLDPDIIREPITAFFSRSNLHLRKEATELIPHGHDLLRVAIRRDFLGKLFGNPNTWGDAEIVSATVTNDIAEAMNSALESDLQRFCNDWVEGD